MTYASDVAEHHELVANYWLEVAEEKFDEDGDVEPDALAVASYAVARSAAHSQLALSCRVQSLVTHLEEHS